MLPLFPFHLFPYILFSYRFRMVELAAGERRSLETIKIRLHRGRARLRKELEGKCSFYRDERNELACDRKTSSLKFLKK
jgi:hypothetical protein